MRGGKGSWLLLAPVLLHTVMALDKYIQDADRFPGWKGELPKAGQPGVELAVGEHGKVISALHKQLVKHLRVHVLQVASNKGVGVLCRTTGSARSLSCLGSLAPSSSRNS